MAEARADMGGPREPCLFLVGPPEGWGRGQRANDPPAPTTTWAGREEAGAGRGRQSRVGVGLSNIGPALCTGNLLHFSEPQFPHLENGVMTATLLGLKG